MEWNKNAMYPLVFMMWGLSSTITSGGPVVLTLSWRRMRFILKSQMLNVFDLQCVICFTKFRDFRNPFFGGIKNLPQNYMYLNVPFLDRLDWLSWYTMIHEHEEMRMTKMQLYTGWPWCPPTEIRIGLGALIIGLSAPDNVFSQGQGGLPPKMSNSSPVRFYT